MRNYENTYDEAITASEIALNQTIRLYLVPPIYLSTFIQLTTTTP